MRQRGVPIEPPITQKPITNVFPNPANEVLYYYHNQTDTINGFYESIGYIYDSSGKLVRQWDINLNNITYIINTTSLSSGVYILKVVNNVGEVIETEKIIIQH